MRLATYSPIMFVLLTAATAVHGQNTGLITGSVTDQSGAVIPNAAITIIQKATGVERHITAHAVNRPRK